MSQMQIVPLRNAPRPAAGPEQNLTTHFVLGVLRRWWKIATPVGLLLAAVGGLTVYLLFEPVYEADALFQIEERTPFLAFESKDEGRSNRFFQTQISLIRDRVVLGPVIKRTEIASQPEIARQPDKVAWLSKQIKVTLIGESDLFRVLYAAPDPKRAAAVVNAVTESYFNLRDQSDSTRNQRIIELLQQEKSKRSLELERLRNDVRVLAEQAVSKDPSAAKREREPSRKDPLADVQSLLIAARVDGAVLEARIKEAEEGLEAKQKELDAAPDEKGGGLSKREIALRDVMAERAVEESPEVRRQKEVLAAKRARLSDTERLLVKGKRSSVYDRLAAEIKGDEKVLDQLRAEIRPRALSEAGLSILAKRTEAGSAQVQRRIEELAKLRSDREALRVREKLLKEQCEQEHKEVAQSSGDTLKLEFKRNELEREEKVFAAIAERVVQLDTERGAPARVTLVQAAEPPTTPEMFPYRNMALAMLAGLCLPFGLVVTWERLVGRVSDSMSLERQSHVSVLGEIAHLPARTPVAHHSSSNRIRHDLRLFEESIDSLRTSLSLSEEFGNLRVLAVTSAANREGKTSVASQLAVSFTRATGKPLLLIDGDMRCPDVHNVFDVPLEPGLAQVLSGKCGLEEAIVTTWSDLVHLLPAGKLEVSPHSLLGNGAWTSLMAKIPPFYRYVIIDTPPVLSASEALVLAKSADASLVCVMRDVSRVDQIRRILDRLSAAGGHPIGLVLNGVPAKDYSYRWGDYSYSRK